MRRSRRLTTGPYCRTTFPARRCLVPASGFYEWQAGTRQPYRIARQNRAFIGLCRFMGAMGPRAWRTNLDDDGLRKHRFASHPVAKVAEDGRAQGTRQEAERIGAKRRDGAQRGIGKWEKQLIEDQYGGCAVDQEIVPFAADCCASNRALDAAYTADSFRTADRPCPPVVNLQQRR